MAGKRGTRLFSYAGDHIQCTGRKANLLRELRDPHRREAGVFRWFHDYCIAHGKSRRKASAKHLRWIVPGNNVASDAFRFTQDGNQVAIEERNGITVELICGSAIELEIAGGRGDIGPRLLHWLAAVARFQLGEFLVASEDCFSELAHQTTALDRRHPAPGTFLERVAGGFNGRIDILLCASGYLGESPTVARAYHVHSATVRGIQPFTVNEILELGTLFNGKPRDIGIHLSFLYCLSGKRESSTRRFAARPASLSLLATGWLSPAPMLMVRSGLTPLPIR